MLQRKSSPALCPGSRRIAGQCESFDLIFRPSLLRCPASSAAAPFANSLRPGSHVTYAVATVEATAASTASSGSSGEDSTQEQQQQQQRRRGEKSEKPIIVGQKPAANALLRRLELAPQTLIRAQSSSAQHTYRTITTIAAAQGVISQPGKVLLYVPFTKSSAFTAIVLPASNSVEQKGPNTPQLIVKASTDPKDLANTLTHDLVKHGSAVVLSAGSAATACAAEALCEVRQQLLGRGYEVGVLPRFQEGAGSSAESVITVLSQQIVLQELPVPRVTVPRNPNRPVDSAAAVAKAVLQKQQRVQLLLPPSQVGRLSGLLNKVMQQDQSELGEDKAQKEGVTGKGRRRAPATKRRLLVVWPPSTADQLLESLEQLSQFTTTALQTPAVSTAEDEVAVDMGLSAAAAADLGLAVAADLPAAGAGAAPAVEEPLLQLQLRKSRLTVVPSPQDGPTGPGYREDRKPAVATADSSVSGLAGAIEARVSRAGVAWVRSDGSARGNAAAWEALFLASDKMDAADGAGGLLALVDVQNLPQPQKQQRKQSAAAAAATAATTEAQQEQQEGSAAQQPAAAPKGKSERRGKQQQQQQQPARESPHKLQMLVVRDSEIARSILQAPGTPLEVSVSADLWPLLKLATAANTFLPINASTGMGGLLLLPAVLPVPEPTAVATDYRFEDQKQQLVPYSIRLQRFTGTLPEGMEVDDSQQLRVSLSTDPIKLRDAIVAKVLQQQPASVRFVGPLGRTPPLMTIAMAAVAAARVRLQQKGAAVDVGVMPYAETLRAAAGEDGDGAAASASSTERAGRRSGGRGGRQQGAAGAQSGRVVYSLRLVPLPAAAAAAAADAPAAAGNAESSSEE